MNNNNALNIVLPLFFIIIVFFNTIDTIIVEVSAKTLLKSISKHNF